GGGLPLVPGQAGVAPAPGQQPAGMGAGGAQGVGQPQPAQQGLRGLLLPKQALLGPQAGGHSPAPRKCHSRMLPAMPAFRLSTRSVMGMRTVRSQAAMVASVRPWPSLPMTTQTPPGPALASPRGWER